MKILEYLMWAMLLIESMLALACLLKSIQGKWKRREATVKHESVGDRCLKEVAKIAGSDEQRDILHKVDIAKTMASNGEGDPAAEVLHLCLKRCPTYDELVDRIQAAVMRLRDRGGVRLHAFLIKTAPMIGIAGTVVGLLIAFGSIATVDLSTGINGLRNWLGTAVGGMAAALISTLWGIAISILAKASLDGIHIPNLDAEFARVYEQAELLGETLAKHQIAGWGAANAESLKTPMPERTNGTSCQMIQTDNGRGMTCPDSM